jgi:hypothetical protein
VTGGKEWDQGLGGRDEKEVPECLSEEGKGLKDSGLRLPDKKAVFFPKPDA